MKKFIYLALMVTLAASCASGNPTKNSPVKDSRKLASEELDKGLTGAYLGVADYQGKEKSGPSKLAARVYLERIAGEPENYNVVVLEYWQVSKIAPKYITSNKFPEWFNEKIGYLKNITKTATAYKAIKTEKDGEYAMYPLVVFEDRIEPKVSATPRMLKLDPAADKANPLAGAVIGKSRADEPAEIFFPKEGDGKDVGLQYKLIKMTYEKVKLKSTWRSKFLTGAYLSQYANRKDVVLDLVNNGGTHTAQFKINEDRSKDLTSQKRKAMFTNEKSAFLKGDFNVTSPVDKMFVFTPTNADEETSSIVKGRIGLFIDIFDATESLNQDVVELVLIDSNNPADFLMYYEHPDNGEGQGLAERQ